MAYSSRHLCRAANISPRQMDHWYRRGWLTPFDRTNLGTGVPMEWPDQTVKKAVLMGRLTRAGFIPEKAHEFADACLQSESSTVDIGYGLVLEVLI